MHKNIIFVLSLIIFPLDNLWAQTITSPVPQINTIELRNVLGQPVQILRSELENACPAVPTWSCVFYCGYYQDRGHNVQFFPLMASGPTAATAFENTRARCPRTTIDPEHRLTWTYFIRLHQEAGIFHPESPTLEACTRN